MRTIALLTTGGTIEKTYDEETGILSNRGSQVEMMLKRLRLPGLQIQRLDLMGKDSLEMDDRDRSIILKAVELYLLQDLPVVCLHGTDTMENTAQYLYDHLNDISIPVILTGAMKPFGFEDSDALQNLTEALICSSVLPGGVYIVIHGQVLPLPGVRKNRAKKSFEKID